MSSDLNQWTDEELDAVARAAGDLALCGDPTIKLEGLDAVLDVIYREILDVTPPDDGIQIIVATGPLHALDLARGMVTEGDPPVMSRLGLGHTLYWAASAELYVQSGDLPPGEAETRWVQAVVAYCRAGVWDCVLLDGAAILVPRPVVHVDENDDIHSPPDGGPAVTWGREGVYAHHGVVVPGHWWREPEAISASDWVTMNTEVRRALAERMGWGRYLAGRGATLVDSATAGGLLYELYALGNDDLRLLRKQSPPLHDGSQPWYVEPVPSECRTALGARRWQVPLGDGRILDPWEAEARAGELDYPMGET